MRTPPNRPPRQPLRHGPLLCAPDAHRSWQRFGARGLARRQRVGHPQNDDFRVFNQVAPEQPRPTNKVLDARLARVRKLRDSKAAAPVRGLVYAGVGNGKIGRCAWPEGTSGPHSTSAHTHTRMQANWQNSLRGEPGPRASKWVDPSHAQPAVHRVQLGWHRALVLDASLEPAAVGLPPNGATPRRVDAAAPPAAPAPCAAVTLGAPGAPIPARAPPRRPRNHPEGRHGPVRDDAVMEGRPAWSSREA